MLISRKTFLALLVVVVASLTNPQPAFASSASEIPSLDTFAAQLPAADANQVTGIYANDTFALPVVQQPVGDPGFVSGLPEKLTQFSLANDYATTGLLAHNTLAGAYFTDLKVGQILTIISGDGHRESYRIRAIERYQALQPTSPYSDFVDLTARGKTLSATDLFYHIYNSTGGLVLQTCIESNGNPSWGRLFVIAEAVDLEMLQSFQQVMISFTGQGFSGN